MFDFFKKKEDHLHGSGNASPGTEPPKVFETGKEIQFTEPLTGMHIYQRALSDEHRKLIMVEIQKQQITVSEFINISRQYLAWQERMILAEKNIRENEQKINIVKDKIRDDLKLPKIWDINPQLIVLEKREPPGG